MGKKRNLSEILSEKDLKRIRDKENLEDMLKAQDEHFEKVLSVAEKMTKKQTEKEKYGLDGKQEVYSLELRQLKKYPYVQRLKYGIDIGQFWVTQGNLARAAKFYADAALVAKKIKKPEIREECANIVNSLLKQLEKE